MGVVEKLIKKVLGFNTVNDDEDDSYGNMTVNVCIHTVCNCGREVLDDDTNEKLMNILKIKVDEM